MGKVILVNGPFSAGKTVLANQLVESFSRKNEVLRVVDGPHLVNLITVEAHGAVGREPSVSHFHPWNRTNPLIPHSHREGEESSHFPFTVIDREIGAEMFKRFTRELLEVSERGGLVVAELGTGRRVGCEISQADFSAETYIRVLGEEGVWPVFKENTTLVVAVEADWGTRLERNRSRKQLTDGITSSWGMQEEGLRLTFEPDFPVWSREGLVVLPFNNNQDGPEGVRRFVEGEIAPLVLRERVGKTIEVVI